MEFLTNQVLAGIATGAIYACMALAVNDRTKLFGGPSRSASDPLGQMRHFSSCLNFSLEKR
jgi:hypothetical protein